MPGSRLVYEDRVLIESLWRSGASQAKITVAVGRDKSTVSREIARNNAGRHGPKHGDLTPEASRRSDGGLYRWGYSASWAQRHAATRAKRPKLPKLARAGAVVQAPARRYGHTPDPGTAGAPADGSWGSRSTGWR